MEGYYKLTREFSPNRTVRDLIGRGLDLDNIGGVRGRPVTNGGIDRVVQSMKVILSTPKGSRFFNPSFGSLLHSILFDQNIFSKRSLAKLYAEQAIHEWEPRVLTVDVVPAQKQEIGVVSLRVIFKVVGDDGAHEFQYDLSNEGGSVYEL